MSKVKSWIIRAQHIVDAIKAIQSYIHDMDEEEFYEDQKTIQAVERNFQIIGEAAKLIPEDVRHQYSDIEWRDMADMRNVIVHQYDDIEEHILWRTIHENLVPLRDKLEKLLGKISDERS